MGRPKDLPDFGKPPVVETVLSVQFEPVVGLTAAHMGLLWERFRQEFPFVEEHPPLPQVMEKFEPPAPPQVEVTFEEKSPVPRFWFLNKKGSELVQVQTDRLIHNWRKTEGPSLYPHYEPIRDKFRREVGELQQFLAEENLGILKVNQCEVTYVNHIEPLGVWETHGEAEKIFGMCSQLNRASFLPGPEDVGVRVRFLIQTEAGKSIGRLHMITSPAWKKSDNSPIFAMNLTARGAPLTESIEGAFAFLDLGRSWIVKGFADLTTPAMHRAWERLDD